MSRTTDKVLDIENAKDQARAILEEMLENYEPEYVWELMIKLQDQEPL